MIGQGLRVIRLALAIKGCAAQCVGLCIPRDRRVEPLCHVDEHAGHIGVLDEGEACEDSIGIECLEQRLRSNPRDAIVPQA
jgi:hypothetical protein